MTAPDRTTWTVAEDPDGCPTIWDEQHEWVATLDVHILLGPQHRNTVWKVLERVLAPDEATICDIENRANAMDWVTPHEHIEAVLAALAGHVPSDHEAEAAS